MNKISYQIVFLYFLSLLFLYPIAAHTLMYKIGCLVDKLPYNSFWIKIQIFLSGPMIIILGSILYFKYGQIKLNKFFGIVFILVGIYWLYILITDIIKEAA